MKAAPGLGNPALVAGKMYFVLHRFLHLVVTYFLRSMLSTVLRVQSCLAV